MKKIIFFGAIIALMLACKKKSPTQPILGSIFGRITPVGIFTTVYATNVSGERLSAEVSSRDGSFTFDKLNVGSYTLNLPTDPRFYSMANLSVEVLPGKSTDLGTLSYQAMEPANGAIFGNLLPQGFGEGVTATNLTTGQSYTALLSPTVTQFMLALPKGDYLVSFKAVRPAEAPADVRVTVHGDLQRMGDFFCKPGNSGSILAKCSPITAVASAKVTHVQTGEVVLGAINRTDATISFPVLPEGAYKLALDTYAPYLSLAERDVTVLPSKQTDLGTLSFQQDVEIRQLAYSINGKRTMRYNVSGIFNDGLLKFSYTNVRLISGMLDRKTYEYATLSVSMGNITGPGVYAFSGASNATISYSETKKVALTSTLLGNWGVTSGGVGGKMEILSFDPVARRIKGTFSASLNDLNPGALPANIVVTEGIFNVDY